MLKKCQCVADIGCDHGRVSVALLQQRCADKVIAVDVSEPSLDKAKQLINYIGMSDKIQTRLGNGFSKIEPNECNAAVILGMGGELMASIIEQCDTPLQGAECVVMQPMRGQKELRAFLHNNCYHIVDDVIVKEGRRYYQVFSAKIGKEKQALPDGWPRGCYELGFIPCLRRDALFKELLDERIKHYSRQLDEAMGTAGETRLRSELKDMLKINRLWEENR